MRSNEDLNRLLDAEGAAAERDMTGDREPVPGTKVTRGHSRAKTLQVRLNEDEYAALRALAEDRNLPVSTLVRSMLLPALTSSGREHGSQGPSQTTAVADTNVLLVIIERMRSELDQLSQRIAS